MNAEDVTPNILIRLTGHALVAFLASAEKFEAEAGPGIWKVISGEPVADLRVRYAPLRGIEIPLAQVPLAIDEFPALFIAAACADGTTVLRGAEELRVKESDRIDAMARGLEANGVTVEEGEEIVQTLTKRYEGIARRVSQMDAEDVFQAFINAFTLSVEPHTSYMSPRSSENFDISMRLSLEGIGAVLSTENEYTEVQRLVKGGPAEKAGGLPVRIRARGSGRSASEARSALSSSASSRPSVSHKRRDESSPSRFTRTS